MRIRARGVVVGAAFLLFAGHAWSQNDPGEAARQRAQAQNNLRQISLALHGFYAHNDGVTARERNCAAPGAFFPCTTSVDVGSASGGGARVELRIDGLAGNDVIDIGGYVAVQGMGGFRSSGVEFNALNPNQPIATRGHFATSTLSIFSATVGPRISLRPFRIAESSSPLPRDRVSFYRGGVHRLDVSALSVEFLGGIGVARTNVGDTRVTFPAFPTTGLLVPGGSSTDFVGEVGLGLTLPVASGFALTVGYRSQWTTGVKTGGGVVASGTGGTTVTAPFRGVDLGTIRSDIVFFGAVIDLN